ncbi:hypothetical protein MBCUR_03330 [Methanobrevibacter curvatus]|uniref:Uncharacterized protein n=1 Tax=Methanobrevibacter curvatus TaxID=49547 RepID=A0A166CX00_9EURY|nr:hypothetical protein MBCUR_03330 [Methanobrevibacter curvatus]
MAVPLELVVAEYLLFSTTFSFAKALLGVCFLLLMTVFPELVCQMAFAILLFLVKTALTIVGLEDFSVPTA